MAKKLILDADEGLWEDVQVFRIKHKLKNNNEAVVELIKRGLGKKK